MRTLLKTAAATSATAVVGAMASSEGRSGWYARLDKPSFQPPAAAFPIVWTTLYTDIALTSAEALDRLRARGEEQAARRYRRALALNLALNASWTWVFFKGHRLSGATVVAGALTLSSADLVRRTGDASRPLGVALAPYAGWCGFATVLSETIRRRNEG